MVFLFLLTPNDFGKLVIDFFVLKKNFLQVHTVILAATLDVRIIVFMALLSF